MPVNLDFGNDMIAAYSRGAQERENQIKRLQDAADKQVELKQHQQQLDQEADHMHNLIDLSRSAQALEQTKAAQGAQMQQAETGQTPAGYNPVYIPNAQDPSKMDIQQYINPQNPVASRFLPPDVNEMARRSQIGLQPKTDEEIRKTKAVNDAEQVRQLAVAEENGRIRERIRTEEDAARTKIESAHDAARIKSAGMRVAAVKSGAISASGLNTIAGQYSNDKDLERAKELAVNVADTQRIDPNTDSAENDNRLIYSAARLVNPGIGVRNFESKDIRDAAQSAADTLGISVSNFFDRREKLTVEARQKLKDFILQGSQASFDAADQKYANYQSRVRTLAPNMPQSQIDGLLGPPMHQTLLKQTNYKPLSALPTVTTKAQFDALKSKDKYIGDDGKPYQKP